MTSKEKAEEIYWTYYQLVTDCQCPEERAKRCALVHIEGIIEAKPLEPIEDGYYELTQDIVDDAIQFWQSVKEEMKKL